MNRIATIFARHWVPIAAFNLCLITGTSAILATTPRTWTAQSEMILPTTTRSLNADLGTLGILSGGEVAFSQQLNPLKALSSILLSDQVMDQVLAEDPEKDEFSRLGSYKDLFSVSPENESTVITLTATGSSPEIAEERLVRLIDVFQSRLIELRQSNALQSSQLVEQEMAQAEKKLQEARQELTSFQASANLVDVDSQTNEAVVAISQLTRSQAEVFAQARAKDAQSEILAARLNMSPEQAVQALRLGESDRYRFFQQKLSEVTAALVEAQAIYTNQHPTVQNLLFQRDELLRQVSQSVSEATSNSQVEDNPAGESSAGLIQQLILTESESVALQQQAVQMQALIDQLNQTLRLMPAQQARLAELQRRYEIAEGIYKGLVAKTQEAKLGAFSAYPNVQVLDQPDVDPLPTEPKVKLILLGALMASVTGSAAIALLLESRNPLLTLDDIQSTDLPTLGNIRSFQGFNHGISFENTEVFQHLASAISMLPLSNQRLMITSATAGEGKSTVTLGLGMALVALGFRVLLVDGDFRQAKLSQVVKNFKSFSVGEPNAHALFSLFKVYPNLDLLSLSEQQGNILEFIAHGQFEYHLNSVQEDGQYDYVVLDSSPISSTSETALLSRIAENVLLVVRPGTSNRNLVGNSLERIEHHQARIVGLVLNGVDTPVESYLSKNRNATAEP